MTRRPLFDSPAETPQALLHRALRRIGFITLLLAVLAVAHHAALPADIQAPAADARPQAAHTA